MTDVLLSQITEDNKLHLEDISLEAFDNPFQSMSDTIKRNMHAVVSNISNIVKGHDLTDLGINANEFKQTAASAKRPGNSTHIETKDIMVVVPVGFTGDYLGYTKLLAKQFKSMYNLKNDVIVPAHNLILKYIGKPDTMVNINNTDLNRVKFHTEDIEHFKKEMNRYFNAKLKHQALPVGALIKSGNEFDQLVTELSNSILPWMVSTAWRSDVFNSYIELQQSLDLLLVRIEQKPQEYQLNKLNAERLAKLVNDVAVEIELTGAMFVYMNQLIECAIQLQRVIYRKP